MNIRAMLLSLSVLIMFGCGSAVPNRSPLGEKFPTVTGTVLNGDTLIVPDDFAGQKVILVVAYDMDTQFDVDRWGIGFFTAELPLPPVYELPTIPGLIPSLFAGSIDKGMRKGIPEESWKDVITVYGGDGGTIEEWTGSENPRNARVMLLDETGTVVWFHDRGYGLPPLAGLLEAVRGTGSDTEQD